jgi:hypothetical protein
MNFVAECVTMFAPHSKGRKRYGVASVLSTISGTFASRAISPTSSKSNTSTLGLPMDSAKIAFVFSRIAFLKFMDLLGSTSVTVMPRRGTVCVNALCVPP